MQLDNPDTRLEAAKKMVKQFPEEFANQIREEKGLNCREASLELFHYWIRTHNSIKSGSIVDNRKYVAEYLDEKGELDVEGQTLTSHKSAAISKYQEFLKTDTAELEFTSKKNGEEQ